MHKLNEAVLVLLCSLLTTLLEMYKTFDPSQQIVIIIRQAQRFSMIPIVIKVFFPNNLTCCVSYLTDFHSRNCILRDLTESSMKKDGFGYDPIVLTSIVFVQFYWVRIITFFCDCLFYMYHCLYRGILADVIVYIFAHLHTALLAEGNMLDIN